MRLAIFCACFLSIGLCATAQPQKSLDGGFAGNAGIPEVLLNGHTPGEGFSIQKKEINGVALYSIRLLHPANIKADDTLEVYFNNDVNITGGVAIWGYSWGIWSKPVPVQSAASMPANRVQFFYWKESNGTYGAAVPLSGNGYRTTLGSQGEKWGSKSISFDSHETSGEIPAIAVAYGKNPFELFKKIYNSALIAMGRGNNIRTKKTMAEPFNYIGWCTWNSSNLGKDLSEDEVIAGVKTFTDNHFPLGWVLVDDGWFQSKNSQLQSQLPNPQKFPNGFRNMNKRLKQDFGIKYTGVWHAFNGYWDGIDPNSELGKLYKNDLFKYDSDNDPHYFIKPGSEALIKFYDSWYSYFKQQGFDFTKVDNQVSAADMAKNNYPVFSFSERVHHALYLASDKYFNGALINCMDMVPDAYFNFGSSAVARSEEDYFPYQKGEGYDLQHGNASAHVLQAIYNSIYFSQMVYPDFDMFESDNPNAEIHAIARALNCGPVYVTDKPGNQNFKILNALVYHDGRLAHSSSPLLPTEDCLLQVQGKKVFKAFSTAGNAGLLDVFNAADADSVSGNLRPNDVNGLKGNKFLVYEHFTGEYKVLQKYQPLNVSLSRLGYKLYYVVPVKNGFAPIGLTEKYNATAAIIRQKSIEKGVEITIYEGGLFKAYCVHKPITVLVNGKPVANYTYQHNMLSLSVPGDAATHPLVTIKY